MKESPTCCQLITSLPTSRKRTGTLPRTSELMLWFCPRHIQVPSSISPQINNMSIVFYGNSRTIGLNSASFAISRRHDFRLSIVLMKTKKLRMQRLLMQNWPRGAGSFDGSVIFELFVETPRPGPGDSKSSFLFTIPYYSCNNLMKHKRHVLKNILKSIFKSRVSIVFC